MENNKKNFNHPFRVVLIHSILYPITYALDILNYTILLNLKYKSFFISCYVVQGLVIIFMIKMLSLFKSKYDSTYNIKCTLIMYSFLSIISLIFVIIEYILIFKNLDTSSSKMDKKYKLPFIIMSILYHSYHNLIFIYESYIIIKAIKKHIEERINGQISDRRNIQERNKNETRSSDKPKKVESFIKQDTIFIIQGKFHDNNSNFNDNISNMSNICSIKKIDNSSQNLKLKNENINQENYQDINNNNQEEDNKKNKNNLNGLTPKIYDKIKTNFVKTKPEFQQNQKSKMSIFAENNI